MPSKRAVAMARLAEIMADSDEFGYSQKPPSGRWGPDFDCSSFIYFIAWLSGYSVGIGSGKVRFTGQMTKDFKDAGFQLLPFANVGLGDLEIGDILLNLALHAEVYIGEGQVVGAQASETGTYVGESGDQTGSEIVKQPAYILDKGWDYVLRPPADEEESNEDGAEAPEDSEGEDQMAYPYGANTYTPGNWMPNAGGMRTTGWMPPMQNYGGYPQGNVGQMNGYSSAGGYQGNQANPMPYSGQQQMYPQGNQGGYPQGGQGKHLTHINELEEIKDIHVGPGECIPVFIGEGRYMALKSADQEGFPNVRVFSVQECSEEFPQYGGWSMPQGNWMGQPQQESQDMGQQMQQPRMQQSQGVSREEFDQLKEMIGNVQSAISNSGFPQGNADGTASGSNANASGNQKQQSSGRNSRNS